MNDCAQFGIRETPADSRVSGFVAIVVQPDAETIRASYELAAALVPESAEQRLAPGSLPHITLTQCPVREAPRERLAAYVAQLDGALRGASILLNQVVPFGGGFLFWCVEDPSAARARLQQWHERALDVGEGLLDPVVNARVVEQTRKATNDDPSLVAYAERFGYAFARDRYLPHITLGFDTRLAPDRGAGEPQSRPYVMTAERVVLARMGALGRVEHILSLPSASAR